MPPLKYSSTYLKDKQLQKNEFLTYFSIFIFFKSDGHKSDFQTIDDLIENGFEFFMDPSLKFVLQYSKFYEK